MVRPLGGVHRPRIRVRSWVRAAAVAARPVIGAEGDDGHPPPADVSGQPDGDDRAADDLHCGEATTFATQLGGSGADVDEAGRGRLDRRGADRPSRREAPQPERRRHDEGGRQRRLAEALGDARRVQR